jgi:hypothetical protein
VPSDVAAGVVGQMVAALNQKEQCMVTDRDKVSDTARRRGLLLSGVNSMLVI